MHFWALSAMEVILSTHLRSCEMVLPRNLNDSALLMAATFMSWGRSGESFLPEIRDHFRSFKVAEFRVIVAKPISSQNTSPQYMDSSPSEMRLIHESMNLKRMTDG